MVRGEDSNSKVATCERGIAKPWLLLTNKLLKISSEALSYLGDVNIMS